MRIYFDTEFMEDGRTIELLSLGAVREDGEEFYAINSNADHARANEFVREHVLPQLHLPLTHQRRGALFTSITTHKNIAVLFKNWALAGLAEPLEFWGYYADYDWVVLCQLYGRMVDAPEGFPHFAYDLRQHLNERGFPQAKQPDNAPHHALLDARWVYEAHQLSIGNAAPLVAGR